MSCSSGHDGCHQSHCTAFKASKCTPSHRKESEMGAGDRRGFSRASDSTLRREKEESGGNNMSRCVAIDKQLNA